MIVQLNGILYIICVFKCIVIESLTLLKPYGLLISFVCVSVCLQHACVNHMYDTVHSRVCLYKYVFVCCTKNPETVDAAGI